MGFNTFRGDNRTFAVILLAPAADHELRVLRHEQAWRAACSAITPLDVMTSADYARPITEVMPMGGLMNVIRTGDPGVLGIIAVGDAFCHTDPAFAYGLSFALAHAQALAHATAEAPDGGAIVERYRADAGPELASGTRSPAPPTRRALALEWRAAGDRPTRQLLSPLLVRGCPGRGTPRPRGPPAHHPSHRSTRPHRRIRRGRRPA